eukprot:41391-Alexandrium_andersonii.AAC.1
MSASLVGSEMCIRDSRQLARVSTHPELSRLSRLPSRAFPGLRHHRQGPVSYTHLTLPTICSV